MLDINDPKINLFGNFDIIRELSMLIKRNRIIPFVGAGMSIYIYGSWGSSIERIMDGHIFGKNAKNIKELINVGRYETAAQRVYDLMGKTSY